ncbi:hypothetical protein C7R95_25060, partial [Enterobacter hormaechei]
DVYLRQSLIRACLFGLLLAWNDFQVIYNKLAFNQVMPALIVIERNMFHITQVGVLLLTLTICTGLFYMKNRFRV